MEKEPAGEQLVICTTHQLMKYYQAFDLLIIDEVDSFPLPAAPSSTLLPKMPSKRRAAAFSHGDAAKGPGNCC